MIDTFPVSVAVLQLSCNVRTRIAVSRNRDLLELQEVFMAQDIA